MDRYPKKRHKWVPCARQLATDTQDSREIWIVARCSVCGVQRGERLLPMQASSKVPTLVYHGKCNRIWSLFMPSCDQTKGPIT